MCIYIYTYTHMNTYIYIYIYTIVVIIIVIKATGEEVAEVQLDDALALEHDGHVSLGDPQRETLGDTTCLTLLV